MRIVCANIVASLLAACVSVVAMGQQTSNAGGFSELQRAGVINAHDLEVVMGVIERSGESTSTKHYHPGGEFGLVLEGAITITRENQPQIELKAGDSLYQLPGEWHIVSTAIGGAKTVVFRVVEEGRPMVVAVE